MIYSDKDVFSDKGRCCSKYDKLSSSLSDKWQEVGSMADLWLLPRSTSLCAFYVNIPKGTLAVR